MKTNFLDLRNFGRKRPKNEQNTLKNMEKQAVFIDAARREHLANHLPVVAGIVAAAGDAMRANFPALTWDTRALWILAFEPAARAYLCQLIRERAADAAGLNCAWELGNPQPPKVVNVILVDEVEHPAPLSEEIKFNRRLVELQTKDTRAPFLALDGCGIEPFLRTGALYIDAEGRTQIATDAAERLADFCTLYAETPQQAAFVAALDAMKAEAAKMSAAYLKALAVLPAQARKEMSANAGFYMPTLGALASGGQIRITAEDATPRALISFFGLARASRDAAPKFYNLAGIWDYTAEDAAALLGCNLTRLQRLGRSTQPAGNIYPPIL